MRPQVLLLTWLLLAESGLAAQTEFGIDACEYDYSLRRQRVAIPVSSETAFGFCRDTTTNLDSALAAVYRRALASLDDPVKRQASLHVRRTMMRYRVFFLQKMLGEWTEMDEDAARASMKSDLKNLIPAEEEFFADSVRYTPTLSSLDFHPSPLNRILSLRLTPDGWVATVGNAKTTTVCAIFVGSTPVAPAVKEAQPACR